MNYNEILEDLLEAMQDGELERIQECTDAFQDLIHKKAPVSSREMEIASALLDELEVLVY